ncbi:hypothetical protein AAIR29_08995 [Psychrobacter sp. FBL11]|uniref:Uncharacterized protein n=1 Tax=Psychrobacter saeujeotis TaxID=3143436 RepID=A0ABU9X8P4_9GAMM|nr:hypothetical protein [uncultured Psychrobacter sp.]
MTNVSDQPTQYGFAPLAIARIKGAQRANQIAIYLIYAAIIAFMVFGTIASIKAFHDNQLLYRLFFNLPYALIALTIPITIYDGFVIYRYRLNQPSMIALSIGVSTVVLVGGLLFADTAWLGLASWLGVAFLFKANFKRFFNFLEAEAETEEELGNEHVTDEKLPQAPKESSIDSNF